MTQAPTIYDLLKSSVRLTRHDGDFGLEIETETEGMYAMPKMRFWNTTEDGSLRNFGIEYILKSPLSLGAGLEDALEEFDAFSKKVRFLQSPYTSVHAHLNMLNLTYKQMFKFVVTYVLFENVLTRYSGPERESNLFCLSVKDAEGCLDNLLNLVDNIQTRKFARNFSEDSAKYSALNIVPLNKIGSLEIRTFRGTTNINEIVTWLKILSKIKEFAVTNIEPARIVELANSDVPEFFRTVFGNLEREFNYPDRNDLVTRNLYYAAKLVSRVKDWKSFGEPTSMKIARALYKEHLDNISISMFRLPYDNLNVPQRILVEEQFYLNNAPARIVINDGDQ